jgi:glycerol-3-phosphate acyltransferase PlsY
MPGWLFMFPALHLAAFLIAYLLGSIPFGYVLTRMTGRGDIREVGSGNIGATNVLRTGSKGLAAATLLLDIAKGGLAVWIGQQSQFVGAESYAAAGVLIGHLYPVWLRFKGGKGVATSAGAILGVMPIAAVSIFLVWLVVFLTTRYVSLASIVAALALPVVVGVLVWLNQTQGYVLLYFSVAMAALVVWRHRSNISRLRNGTEPRFARK